MWRGVLFDDFHELPTAVRSGKINFIVCQRCGFSGILWPGFLCFDRRRSRLISVVYSREPIASSEAQIQDAIDYCAAHEPDIPCADKENRHITVESYEHILEKLTLDEHLFAWEARQAHNFRKRCRESDLPSRARMFLESIESGDGILLEGTEGERPFRLELLRQAKLDIRNHPPGSLAHDRGAFMVAHAEPLLSTVHSAREGGSTLVDNGMAEAPAGARSLDVIVSPELAKLAALALRDWRPEAVIDRDAPDWLTDIAELANQERLCAPPTIERPADWHFRASNLQSVIEMLSPYLPDVSFEIHYAEPGRVSNFTRQEVVTFAAGGWRPFQGIVHQMVFRAATGGEGLNAIEAGAKFFTSVARNYGDFDCIIYACSAVIRLLEESAASKDVVGWVGAIAADAHARLTANSPGHFGMHEGAAIPLAIAWQRLARGAGGRGRHYLASLCSAVAARLAELSGRKDGAITSRTDGIEAMSEMGQDVGAELSRLIEEARGRLALETADDEPRHILLGELRRLLLLRCRVEFAQERDRIRYLTLEFGSSNEDVPAELPVIFDPSERIFGRSTPGIPAMAPEMLPGVDGDIEPGCVIIMGPAANADNVITAKFINCRWFSTFAEILDADDELMKEDYRTTYTVLLELIGHLREPGLFRYFVRAVKAEAQLRGNDFDLSVGVRLMDAKSSILLCRAAGQAAERDPEMVRMVVDLDEVSAQIGRPRWDSNVDEFSPLGLLVELGELNESVGRFAEAAELFARAGLIQLNSIEPRSIGRLGDTRQFSSIRPIYRAARALAKQHRAGASHVAEQCVELAELCKIHSQSATWESSTPAAQKDFSAVVALTNDLPIRLGQLHKHCPAGSAFLMEALLHETELNQGFWLTALLIPGESPWIRLVPFDEVYKPYQTLDRLMNEARAQVINTTLAEVPSVLAASSIEIDAALEELADALLPSAWVDRLERQSVDRLYIVSEAYLHDLPWAALRVLKDQVRQPLASLGNGGSLALSLLPSIGTLARPPARPASPDSHPLRIIAASTVPWRPELDPIYGLEPRLRRIASQAAEVGGFVLESNDLLSSAGVLDLIKMLRESKISVFFGHGEITSAGTTMLTGDGAVGEEEIVGALRMTRFESEVSLLMVCSGVSSVGKGPGREVSGCHMALVQGGVGCVIGSCKPLFPIIAFSAVETMLPQILHGSAPDQALALVRDQLRSDHRTNHPLFWSYLTCFGNGGRH